MITLVTLMCHLLEGIASPVCHEVVVAKLVMPMEVCQMHSQIIIADWKEKSIYQGDKWTVSQIECLPGNYQPKDAI